jgi:hypothetical protein
MRTALMQQLRRGAPSELPARAARAWAAFESALARDSVWIGAIAFAATLQVSLIVTHIPWLDELQALLIAWQSPDLSALLENLRYEGHPPLWYLLLRGVARVLPFEWVLSALSIAMALAIQALILAKAPFARSERLLLVLSEFALIEFGTISRSLALGALMVVAAASFWRSRLAWLAIALLPMCDFLFGVLSILLLAVRFRDRLVWLPGLAAWGALSALAAWTVIPASDVVPAEYHMTPVIEVTDFVQRIGALALPFQTFLGRLAWDGYPAGGTGGIFATVFLCWLWQRTAPDRLQRTLMFGYIGFCFLFSVLVYPLHLRHLTTIALLLIILTWITRPAEGRELIRWRIWLVSAAFCGLLTALIMLIRPFDAAPQATALIGKLADGRRPWLSFPANRAPALFASSGIAFVQPEQGCTHSFTRWNHESAIRNGRDLYRAMPGWAERYGQSFLVLERLPRGIPTSLFRPLAPRLRGYDGQGYVIGILGPDLPVKPRAYPPCVPGMRGLP